MDTIKPLINLLSKQKLKQIEIITEENAITSKTKMLYDGIRNGEYLTDEDAAKAIYDSNPNSSSYKKLKYRLTQKLINTLFFIDVQSYSKSEYQKALNRCYKNWAAVQILKDKGLIIISTQFLEQILKSSLKFDLIELSLIILKDLKLQYGLFLENKYKYNKYREEYYKLKNIYDLKEKAEDIYITLGRLVTKSKTYELNEEVLDHIEKINVLLVKTKSIDSFYLKYYLFNAAYYAYLIKKDPEMQIEVCDEAIAYFNSKPQFKKIGIFSFMQKAGISYLTKKDYSKALYYLKFCYNFNVSPGSLPWTYIRSYYFQLQILRKDYNFAYELTCEVLNSKGFKKLADNYQEPWYLKEAFIHFLIRIGKIDPNKSKKTLRPFRLTRFLNEISVFSKDKRGLNITINIIQMLFLIVEEKYDAVLDKLTALKQYNFRYLKRPEYSRSSNFIKMLLKIPEGNYEAKDIRRKASKYHQALLANPSDYSEHALSIEIIPYEQLWEEVMSMFEN